MIVCELQEDFGFFEIVKFEQKLILEESVNTWPICDVLIAFYSDGKPPHIVATQHSLKPLRRLQPGQGAAVRRPAPRSLRPQRHPHSGAAAGTKRSPQAAPRNLPAARRTSSSTAGRSTPSSSRPVRAAPTASCLSASP